MEGTERDVGRCKHIVCKTEKQLGHLFSHVLSVCCMTGSRPDVSDAVSTGCGPDLTESVVQLSV